MRHKLVYKIASEPEEMEQIYSLNYKTFVEEIPQHQQNPNRSLIDKFDEENTYFIAKDGSTVVGMIAVRANRPFSLDFKLDDLDRYLPQNANPCEVRLLAVKKEYRSSLVFYQLVNMLVSFSLKNNYNMALISGTDRQTRLYKKMGFEPFGPLTGADGARFQPMYLTKKRFETTSKAFSKMLVRKRKSSKQISFLPGPVPIREEVKQSFMQQAISHRSSDFINEMKKVQSKLCELMEANYVQVAVGTGTFANDLVAAQLKKLSGSGLILANGEFGFRLIDHAKRFGLKYYTLEKQWNEKFSMEEVEYFLKGHQDVKWVWTVHCETSTGYLFNLKELLVITKKQQVELCVDACSSAGVVPMSLKDVYLASTVSGKGLGSYPGLAIVFHKEPVEQDEQIPRYLDLGQYAGAESTPYTHSSNLISALHTALQKVDLENKVPLANEFKKMLTGLGFMVLGNEEYSPGVLTVELPDSISSMEIGDTLKEEGILISYESIYLLKRNWIQFALMGEHTLEEAEIAIGVLQEIIPEKLVQV